MAVEAFLPTVRQSRHASVLVRVIRHARGLRDTPPRTPTAPDTIPPDITPPDITSPWGETGPHHGAASTEIDSAHGAPLGSRVGVGLLLLDATRTTAAATAETPDLDDAVAALAPGGVLAVLTTSDRIAGRLRDPRPALIDAARAAGLDYWQHIVTATHPAIRPDGEPRTGRTARHREHTASHRAHADADADAISDKHGPARQSWSLFADISVFRRPALPARVDPGRVDLPDQDATTTEVQP